ncbi:hypothetical protein HYV11_03135 [Candidatus Dependentiae bacterium]|nr:hypothetical protein [Candidatus Dependentiae bacterium]
MKKLLHLLLSIIIIPFIVKTNDFFEPTTLFLGTIKFPSILIDHNDVCLYYKGKKLATEWDKNNSSVQFSFLETKASQQLYLLICNDITCQANNQNTIDYLQLKNNNYLCYDLEATRIYDENDNLINFSWNAKECCLTKKVIPENTIIFLFNPDFIEGIQILSWNKNQVMRLIPTIYINNQISNQEIVQSMAITRLNAIDIDTFHSKKETMPKNRFVAKK